MLNNQHAHLSPHTVPHLSDHHLKQIQNVKTRIFICTDPTFGTAPAVDEEPAAALPLISCRLDISDSGAETRSYGAMLRTGCPEHNSLKMMSFTGC